MATKSKNRELEPLTLRLITPRGTCKFPKLQVPDERFNYYGTGLLVDPDDPKVQAFMDSCKSAIDEWVAENDIKGTKAKPLTIQYPWADDTDKEGEPTGQLELKCRRKAVITSKRSGETYDFSPKIEDSKGTPIKKNLQMGSGTVVQIGVEARTYQMTETTATVVGISLRPIRVRVFDLVVFDNDGGGFEFEDSNDDSFEVGGFTAEDGDGDY